MWSYLKGTIANMSLNEVKNKLDKINKLKNKFEPFEKFKYHVVVLVINPDGGIQENDNEKAKFYNEWLRRF